MKANIEQPLSDMIAHCDMVLLISERTTHGPSADRGTQETCSTVTGGQEKGRASETVELSHMQAGKWA